MFGRFAAGLGILLVLGLASGTARGGAEGEREPGEDLVVTKEGGVRFLSLKDWPIKRAGGVITVATMEEYLSMKFGQVRSRFEQTDARLAALEQRLQQLEDDRTALQRRLLALEATGQEPPQEVGHGDSTP